MPAVYRILVGPQVGANFGIYALVNSTDLFESMILNNPFGWVGGREYLRQDRTADLLLASGRSAMDRRSIRPI